MNGRHWLLAGFALLLLILLSMVGMGVHQGITLLDRRVDLLQQALAPGSPRLAANNWAEAVKTRNGAWQYALLTASLRAKYRSEFEELNWVTGTSSPWVASYTVNRLREDTKGDIYYEIKFNWATAQGYFGSTLAEITVNASGKGSDQVWYIRQINYNDTKMDKNSIAGSLSNGLIRVVSN